MSRIKKGDEVIVISGSHKGKKTKVISIFPQKGFLYLEGVTNKKNKKKTEYSEGGIVDVPKPVNISNVMLVDGSGKATKIAYNTDGKTKTRIAKTTGKAIK